jgi:hypothetical protein
LARAANKHDLILPRIEQLLSVHGQHLAVVVHQLHDRRRLGRRFTAFAEWTVVRIVVRIFVMGRQFNGRLGDHKRRFSRLPWVMLASVDSPLQDDFILFLD